MRRRRRRRRRCRCRPVPWPALPLRGARRAPPRPPPRRSPTAAASPSPNRGPSCFRPRASVLFPWSCRPGPWPSPGVYPGTRWTGPGCGQLGQEASTCTPSRLRGSEPDADDPGGVSPETGYGESTSTRKGSSNGASDHRRSRPTGGRVPPRVDTAERCDRVRPRERRPVRGPPWPRPPGHPVRRQVRDDERRTHRPHARLKGSVSDGVVVRVLTGRGTRAADREALVAFVADVTDTAEALVRVVRRCAHCGAADHGRPAAVVDGHDIRVSLSRTTGVLALAAVPSTTSPDTIVPSGIGVDVERPSRVTAAELDAFTPGERQRAERSGSAAVHLTACWAVKEAVLKQDGRGLRVDPTEVDAVLGCITPEPSGHTARFDGLVQPVTVLRLDDDLVLAVAAGSAPVTVQDRRVGLVTDRENAHRVVALSARERPRPSGGGGVR
ncbi:hypothetical protein DEI89_00735 [Curtobacterium sp. MCBD17_030]|nr:hypothetical protein DEI89_00735 [Curtobacterium sp. MCBD17_030]